MTDDIRKRHNDFCEKHQTMPPVLFDRTIGVPVLLDTIRRACDKIDRLRKQLEASNKACQAGRDLLAYVYIFGASPTDRFAELCNQLHAAIKVVLPADARKAQGDAK